MADHYAGSSPLADPPSDIADVYAFPSPDRPGRLVLVMDVFSAATPSALFSDAVRFRFRLRPVAATMAGGTPACLVGEDEHTFAVTFSTPVQGDRTGSLVQLGTCTTPDGAEIPFRVGEEEPTELHGLRIFAGARLDPYFINLNGVLAAEAQEQLAFRPRATNSLQGVNVLAIVVELDVATLGRDTGPLVAIVGETVTSGGQPMRLERMGRAEMRNILLRTSTSDPDYRDLEIQALYNSEDAFNLSPDNLEAYRALLKVNLAFFDRLDGTVDWPPDDRGRHPLAELLLADFLVIDVTHPFAEDGFLEIERAVLAGRPHRTCGGRSPHDDIVDALYALLIGGLDGPRISDRVDQATQRATRTFPYLVRPNPSPPDPQTVLAALLASPQEAASSPC